MFKLLNRTKGNSINDCDIFKFIIYLGGAATAITQPRVAKNPSYTTGQRNSLST
jgi:hypothetical protein